MMILVPVARVLSQASEAASQMTIVEDKEQNVLDILVQMDSAARLCLGVSVDGDRFPSNFPITKKLRPRGLGDFKTVILFVP
jgi:hypothetical protein